MGLVNGYEPHNAVNIFNKGMTDLKEETNDHSLRPEGQ